MSRFQQTRYHAVCLVGAMLILVLVSRVMRADTGTCSGAMLTLPFTDVPASNIFFCSIAEAYFSGLTNGTSATAYNPSDTVPREQMAAFITRTQDSALKRANRRAAMQQWWTPGTSDAMRATDLGSGNIPTGIVCDGADVWTANQNGTVSRVRASDGKLLGTWTGAVGLYGIVAAAGRIFLTGQSGTSPGKIYVVDPTSAPGPMTVFENDIGPGTLQIAFDGTSLWTANESIQSSPGSISRVDIGTGIDSTFTAGFLSPIDILWDGSNLWVVDRTDANLKRVDTSSGIVLETTNLGGDPRDLLFDGSNIWVNNAQNNSITVVRAVGGLRGTVLATLAGNGLNDPLGIAFDGERVLVCNRTSVAVSLFKAADFTPLGTVSTGTGSANAPQEACSDGLNFWITKPNSHQIVRF